MVRFCPQCGYKLVQDFKFCPECGFELEKVAKEINDTKGNPAAVSDESGFIEKKICDNCGEENDIENTVCSGCGIKLTGAKTGKIKAGIDKPSDNTKKEIKSKTSVKQEAGRQKSIPANTTSVGAKTKSLNKAKTITIIAIGIGVSVIILIFSGLLNSLIVPGNTASNVANNNNQSSGVDLSNIQKINDLETVVKNNPTDTASILDLAHLKNDAGMFEQAIANYKQYLNIVPKNADARIDMGICYYNLQNYDMAISEMEQALKYDPQHQIGYLDLGIVNLSAGKMEKSQEWLKKAVAIDPNSEYGKKAQELLSSHNNQPNGGK